MKKKTKLKETKNTAELTGSIRTVPGGPGTPSAPGIPGRPAGPCGITRGTKRLSCHEYICNVLTHI